MTAIKTPPRPGKIEWQIGRVQAVVVETSRVKSLVLKPASWSGHWAGQHVDIRLTADDGYRAERSYSISSSPEDELLSLTVERIQDGEVSSYLLDELRVGDGLEFRGPIGRHFVWAPSLGGPLCLIAGGAGITPLMAMLRHRNRSPHNVQTLLIYSARSLPDVIYRKELDILAHHDGDLRLVYALTREQPDDWAGHRGRINEALLAEKCFPPEHNPTFYICGPTAFVEDVSGILIRLGFNPHRIKTERFGPSGG